MKITMLYFNTIADLIKKYGFTWEDVNNIQDYKGRVTLCDYEYTLEQIFYSTHMGGFDEYSEMGKILIKAFIQALENPQNSSIGQ